MPRDGSPSPRASTRTANMKRSRLESCCPRGAGLALAGPLSGGVGAEDLLQIYREAQKSDPALAAARSQWEATQERVPQARAALLPNVAALGQRQRTTTTTRHCNSDPKVQASAALRPGQSHVLGVAAALSAAERRCARPGARTGHAVGLLAGHRRSRTSSSARAIAYFDVLLAEFNVELAEQQKTRGVRAARAGQAQFRGRHGDDHRHQRSAGPLRLDRRDRDPVAQRPRPPPYRAAARSSAARRTSLKRLGAVSSPRCPIPTTSTTGSTARSSENLSVRVQQANYDIASLEVDARARRAPTHGRPRGELRARRRAPAR